VPVLPPAALTVGDAFAGVFALLDAAELRHHAAMLAGDANAAFDAEFDRASAGIELARLETDVALNWLLGLRLAVKRYPTETADLIDQVFALRRMMRRK